MSATRLAPRQALRQISALPSRRYASSHASHASHPKAESFSTGTYLTLAAIPTGYLLWTFSSSAEAGSSAITRYIASYDSWRQSWKDRNALHTDAVERAAHDSNLFRNTPMPNVVELKFPEAINGGSPYNVPAGHGSMNLEKVVAKYQQDFHNEEAAKLERLKARGEW